MSDYIKKISTYDYLTWINKKGEVCPRMPKDWKDEEIEDADEPAGFRTRLGGPTALTASKDWKKAVMRYRLNK